jgi:acyl-CoA thioester hydrolase
MDNDAYGHVNNVIYYSWFDTAVNAHLIEQGVLDIHQGETIGLVIETQCNYFAPLAFPQTIEAGIRVAKLGSSSVRYEVGLFAQGAPLTAARGHFVHVYVDRATQPPGAAARAPQNRSGATHVTSLPTSQVSTVIQRSRPASMRPSRAAFPRAPSCRARWSARCWPTCCA